MKVAIFENEFEEIRRAFDGFNLLFYNNSLEFDVFPSSQTFGNLSRLDDYEYVLIDIDLSLQSELDGFQLIKELLNNSAIKKVKPIVLTGQPPIKDKLKAKNLPDLPIINKPLIFNKIEESFKEAKPLEVLRS